MTTQLYPVLRLKMCTTITPLPHTLSWRARGQLYLSQWGKGWFHMKWMSGASSYLLTSTWYPWKFPPKRLYGSMLRQRDSLNLTCNSVTVYTRNISHDSSLGIVNGLWAGWQMCRASISGRKKIHFLSKTSRLVVGPTLPPIQWVPVAVY